jgi:hypothetical protein
VRGEVVVRGGLFTVEGGRDEMADEGEELEALSDRDGWKLGVWREEDEEEGEEEDVVGEVDGDGEVGCDVEEAEGYCPGKSKEGAEVDDGGEELEVDGDPEEDESGEGKLNEGVAKEALGTGVEEAIGDVAAHGVDVEDGGLADEELV